jgi:hypothetical protein
MVVAFRGQSFVLFFCGQHDEEAAIQVMRIFLFFGFAICMTQLLQPAQKKQPATTTMMIL